MLTYNQLLAQTLVLRQTVDKVLAACEGREDEIPAGWNNNARWHAGHLVLVPHALALGLAGEPIGIPEDYRRWFGRGTSPREWGSDPVPTFAQLRSELVELTDDLFLELKERHDAPFAQPYTSLIGVVLNTPAEALVFSQSHDGIHLGLLMALKRALG